MTDDVRTILIVEDDPPLRQLVHRMLEAAGFGLIEAPSGEQALSLARRTRGSIDLLVTDIVLPHMDGFDLAEAITRLHPETRVLYMSGYADRSVAVRGGLKEVDAPFLLKPFTKSQLEQKVAEALSAPTGGGGGPTPDSKSVV